MIINDNIKILISGDSLSIKSKNFKRKLLFVGNKKIKWKNDSQITNLSERSKPPEADLREYFWFSE